MKEDSQHVPFMNRCLDLAILGLGRTAPNPLVGSVIVHRGTIIGEGYHRDFGGPHAEVNAVNSVEDRDLLPESILYVNLEPCSHTGKTPPCANMIIRSGIRHVVIGTSDPNPLVAGRGIEKLKEAGIRVTCDIITPKCQSLNRRFFTFHTRKRPFIILKWAQTTDGFMDILRDKREPAKPNWISNEISRIMVHEWRSEEQAILVGTRTAYLDNPRLNVREWPGVSPIRLVIDRRLTLPKDLHLFDNSSRTVVFNELSDETDKETRFVRLDFSTDVAGQILDWLYTQNIQSIMIEGGHNTLENFIIKGFWDEARVFTGAKNFGSGISAPVIPNITPEEYRIREDILMIYRNPF